MPAGRPVETVPQQKADEILAWIADGKPLREFCRIDGNPAFRTVYDWLAKDQEFSARFAQARESGEDQIAQECLAIADEEPMCTTEIPGKHGTITRTCVDNGAIQRNRLRVDTRLKLLAKWNPKKYGDRTVLAGDPEAPLVLAARLQNAEKRLKAKRSGSDS